MKVDIRTAMAVEPELLKLADALREQFGARLVWLKTSSVEVGRRPMEPEPFPAAGRLGSFREPL